MKRKWLASLLALALLLSLFPTVAFAEESESTPAEQCTDTEGCTLEEGHEGACAIAESETELTAEPVAEPTAEPSAEPAETPTDEPMAEPTENEDSLHEKDEMTEALHEEGVPLDESSTMDTTVSTEEGLRSAITSATGTKETPTVITVNSDIALSGPLSIDGKHIILQGQSGNEKIYAPEDKNTTINKQNGMALTYFAGVTDAANPDMLLIGGTSETSVTIRNIVIDGNSATTAEDGFPASGDRHLRVIHVSKNGTLTMEDGATVTGGSLKNWIGKGAGIVVEGSFTMNGGKVTGIYTSNHGAVKNDGGTFIMNDGAIEKNTASFNSSAIYTTGQDAVTTINGGIIQDNRTTGDSGTVSANNSATLNFVSGEIKNNSVNNGGGGIYVSDSATLNMSGGKISNNTAEKVGGGISVAGASKATISGGAITSNKATDQGAGIYVANGSSLVVEGNTEIRENILTGKGASLCHGGGIAASSSKGVSTIEIKGGLIADNQAPNGGGIAAATDNVTVKISGGTIRDNKAVSFRPSAEEVGGGGGGLYIYPGKNRVTQITGGSILSNEATANGGGVFLSGYDPAIQVSGDVIIKDNTVNDQANDVFCGANVTPLTVAGKLGASSEIWLNQGSLYSTTAIVSSTSDYVMTASDFSKFNLTSDTLALYLDAESNSIKMANAVTVTFNANTGDSSETSTQKVLKEHSTTLDTNSFVRDGYTFVGWNTQQDGNGTKYSDGAEMTFTDAITLYAQWNCNITFDSNGGSGTMNAQTIGETDSTTALSENGFSRDGY